VPIEIPEDEEVDAKELHEYSTKVANHAQQTEPEEAIVFPDSTPLPAVEAELDISEIDISGTVLRKLEPIYELNMV